MNTADAIRQAYRRREFADTGELYSLANPAALFLQQQREKRVLDVLKQCFPGSAPLSGKKVLDVGCGTGAVMRDFLRYGAQPHNCYGIDMLPERIATARQLSPNMNFVCENGESIPFETGQFDVVVLFTVLTSILDEAMKQNLAAETMRVLKPGGLLLYYDFMFDNPRNREVKGVRKTEITRLFPGCELDLKRTTLASPVTRRLASKSTILCQFLEKAPFLCTHYLGKISRA